MFFEFTILPLIKFLITYTVVFIFIPSTLIEYEQKYDTCLDKLFISLIHSNTIVIIAVHLLSFLKLYETFSIITYMLFVVYIIRKIKDYFTIKENKKVPEIINFLDMREYSHSYTLYFKKRLISVYYKIKSLKEYFVMFIVNSPNNICLLFILVVTVYTRFKHSIIHLYFGASDSYVHLTLVKFLGNNKIYAPEIAKFDTVTAGVYPAGFHAIISALSKTFIMDPYYIMRFIGPLTGVLIVLSIMYILVKNTKSTFVIVTSLIFYVIYSGLPSDIWRQISPLPQEYATIFFLPGIYFICEFLKTKNTKLLILSGECLALTILIHPYVFILQSIAYLVVVILNLKAMIRKFIDVMLVMGSAVILGLLPLGIGYFILNIPLNGSFGYAKNAASIKITSPIRITSLLDVENNLTLIVFLILTIILLTYLIKEISVNNKKHYFYFGYLAITILLYILYRAEKFGLPILMDVNRIGIFLSILIPVVIGLAICLIKDKVNINVSYKERYRRISFVILVTFIISIYLTGTYIKSPIGMQYEYDQNVEVYLKIKNEYPPLNWTIISTQEHYNYVEDYGRHTQIWEFTKAINEKSDSFKFTTDYIFLVVEKKSLFSGEDVNMEYSLMPFPKEPPNLSDYYKDKTSRQIIQSKAYFWAEEALNNHNNTEIYYENSNIKVYKITQNGSNPINLLKWEGK